MLRNIDRCEALIFTTSSAVDQPTSRLRRGVSRLLAEASDDGALVALLEPPGSPEHEPLPGAVTWPTRAAEPTVAELTSLRESMHIAAPAGFAGAPGAAWGCEPVAARCVVLVTSLGATAAALGAGMRAVGVPPEEEGWLDERPTLRRGRDAAHTPTRA